MSELQPIDIEINMRQNVSEEAPKVVQGNEDAAKSTEILQQEIDRLNKVVADMTTALAEQRKMTADSVGDFEEATEKIDAMESALEQTKSELAAYESILSEANKATQEGADVTEVLADARKNLAETEESLTNNAKDLIDNQKAINDAIAESNDATEKFSLSNEASGMAIREVANALGIENAAVVTAISNTNNISTAKKVWTTITTQLTAAQLALSATILGGVVAAIGAAIYSVVQWYKHQQELIRIANQEKNLLVESAAAVQEKTSRVKVLDKVLNDSTRSYKDRNSALNELKTIMPEYNAQLSKEGELIKDNTNAVQKYIEKLRDQEMAKRVISELADVQVAFDEWRNKNKMYSHLIDLDGVDTSNWKDGAWQDWQNKKKEFTDEMKRLEALAEKYITVDSVEEGTKAYWQNQKQQAEDLLATMKKTEEGSKKWNDALKQYKEAEKQLATWDFKESNPKSPTSKGSPTNTLANMSDDLQKRIDQARVKSIQEGAEKERAAIRAEYDATLALIAQKLREIEELEKKTGKPATEQRELLFALDVEASRQFESQLGAVNTNALRTMDALTREVNTRFASELDNNLEEIKRYYDSVIAEAKRANKEANLTPFIEAREKNIKLAELDSELRALDFEQMVASRKMALSDKLFLFESDRLKQQYNLERDFAQKRIALFQKQHDLNPTTETQQALTLANLELEELDASIRRLQPQKMRELTAYASMLASSIADVTGADIAPLSNMLSGVMSVLSGDAMGAISSGLGMVSSIASSILNKGEQERIFKAELIRLQQEYNVELRQQNVDLIDSVNYVRLFRDNLESLQWLIEKGFISDVDYSTWEVYKRQADEIRKHIRDIEKEQKEAIKNAETILGEANFESPAMKAQRNIQKAWQDGTLKTADAIAQLGKSLKSKSMENLGEQIKNNKEETDKWVENLKELAAQMDEFATGTSFDGFLDSAANAIMDLRGDVSNLGKFTEETLSNAVLSSFKYQILSEALKPYYEELADKFIDDYDGLDAAWANNWRSKLEHEMGEKGKMLNELFETMGIDPDNSARQGAKGGFANASQDSINELNGTMYAVRQMMGDIRQTNKDELLVSQIIASQMDVLVERSEYWVFLEELKTIREDIRSIEAHGLKMKA